MFSVTHDALLRKNIRHLYYGEPLQMHWRIDDHIPTYHELLKASQLSDVRKQILYGRKKFSNNVELPTNPACRRLPQKDVQDITQRLHQPIVRTNRHQVHEPDRIRPVFQKHSKDDVDRIVCRLYYSSSLSRSSSRETDSSQHQSKPRITSDGRHTERSSKRSTSTPRFNDKLTRRR